MEIELIKLKDATSYQTLWNQVYHKSKPNLGTLGSGNHFIEILISDGETWLVVHSGSRDVGYHLEFTLLNRMSMAIMSLKTLNC